MQEFIAQNQWIIYAVVIWSLPWKGIALWKAAKDERKMWFILLFLINTLGILDIVYIVFLSERKKSGEEIGSKGPTILSNGKRIV